MNKQKLLATLVVIVSWAISSQAQTVAELEAEIAALEAEVKMLRGYVATVRPTKDCDDVFREGDATEDGLYYISVNDTFVEVYCQYNDSDTSQHWMVIQRRNSGDEDFYLSWQNYTEGFGNRSAEYWLGLDNMAFVTEANPYTLRVVLTDFDDKTYYADYSSFRVSNSTDDYKLEVSGYNGTAGDSLTYHNGQAFSTYDDDNDSLDSLNCAEKNDGAWWYSSCYRANLNGLYFDSLQHNFSGIVWFEWGDAPYTRKAVEMKIRPN